MKKGKKGKRKKGRKKELLNLYFVRTKQIKKWDIPASYLLKL
jgi:hypothetical protein